MLKTHLNINLFNSLQFGPSSFVTYHRIFNKSNSTSANGEAVTASHSGLSEFTPFKGVCVAQALVFCDFVLFLVAFVFLYFDLWLLITPLVPSKGSDWPYFVYENQTCARIF